MDMLEKRLGSEHEIACGVCGSTDDHSRPDDRKAIPIFNGEPTTSDVECDGYRAVCATCYQRWITWDKQMLSAKKQHAA